MINIPQFDTNDAHILIEGARIHAKEIGIPMCIAVTVDSSNFIAFERMGGGKAHSILIAQDKTYTADAVRKATHEYHAINTAGNLTLYPHR